MTFPEWFKREIWISLQYFLCVYTFTIYKLFVRNNWSSFCKEYIFFLLFIPFLNIFGKKKKFLTISFPSLEMRSKSNQFKVIRIRRKKGIYTIWVLLIFPKFLMLLKILFRVRWMTLRKGLQRSTLVFHTRTLSMCGIVLIQSTK